MRVIYRSSECLITWEFALLRPSYLCKTRNSPQFVLSKIMAEGLLVRIKQRKLQLKLICGISLKKQWEQSAVTVTKHVVYAIFEVFPTRVYNVGAISLNCSQVSGWILIGYKSRQTGRILVQFDFNDRSYDSPKKFDLNWAKRHSLKWHEQHCNMERFLNYCKLCSQKSSISWHSV